MYFSIAAAAFAIVFNNILYFTQSNFMEFFEELALESAESLRLSGAEKEKRVGKRVLLRAFSAEENFGEKGKEREKGVYHTLLLKGNILEKSELSEEVSQCAALSIKTLLKGKASPKRILAVGLGNPLTVVDSLGSETIKKLGARKNGKVEILSLTPSVFGLTGIESAEVVRGVKGETNPDLVLAVDTLATRRSERLCRALQLTNAGIAPGGGVGNRREVLSENTIGVPVLSIGVPLLCHAELCSSLPSSLVVTPKEIDLIVPLFAEALSRAIERAFL